MTHHNSSRGGFALLITLLVVTVIVSISVAIIELSIKQLALSVTARDSEIAFHAANAGMECVRYTQRVASTSLSAGTSPLNYYCFNQPTATITTGLSTASLTLNGNNYTIQRYSNGAGTTWNSDRCTKMDFLVIDVSLSATEDLEISNINSIYPGYTQNDGNKTCPVGSTCYIAEVTGYNNACTGLTAPDTVRRELLLEF